MRGMWLLRRWEVSSTRSSWGAAAAADLTPQKSNIEDLTSSALQYSPQPPPILPIPTLRNSQSGTLQRILRTRRTIGFRRAISSLRALELGSLAGAAYGEAVDILVDAVSVDAASSS